MALAAVLLLLVSLAASTSPWSTQIVSGPRVVLNYPSLISVETARRLLADRGRALAFAEEVLGGRLLRRLVVTIEPTLLVNAGFAEPSEGSATITFYIPVHALERCERDGTPFFGFVGCHEEVHAVVDHLWSGTESGPPVALSEGVAVYVDELQRESGVHHAIAAILQTSGLLCDLDCLLGPSLSDQPEGIAHLNTYYGGASLAEFLISQYGIGPFSILYGVEWFRWSIQHREVEVVEADPSEEILGVYGKTAAGLSAEWHAWAAPHATGTEADAALFLRAFSVDIMALDAGVSRLEEYWAAFPLRLVGPSSLVAGLYEDVTNALFDLATLQGVELEAAYAEFCRSVERLQILIDTWLDAIHEFREALALIGAGEVSERVIELLRSAEVGYEAAEDSHMVERVRDLLAEYAPTEAATSSD